MRHVMMVRDAVTRAGAEALVVAMGVHAMTDNTYGTPSGMIWAGVLFGVALRGRSKHGQLTMTRWIPGPRMAAWPLALLAAWALTRETSIAFMQVGASPPIVQRSVATSLQGEVLSTAWRPALEELLDDPRPVALGLLLDTVEARVGPAPGILRSRALLADRRLAVLLASASSGAIDAAAVEQPVAVLARAAIAYPWEASFLERLGAYDAALGGHVLALPPRVASRLAWLAGDLTPAPLPGTRYEVTVDAFQRARGQLRRGAPPERWEETLRTVVVDFGGIPDVFLACIEAGGTTAALDWLPAHAAALAWARQHCSQAEIAAAVRRANSAAASARLWRRLTHLIPDLSADVAQGHLVADNDVARAVIDCWARAGHPTW